MSREGALTGGRALAMPPGADVAAAAGVSLALSKSWPVGVLSGVVVAAEVDACLWLAALSSAGSSSSPAMALPATCTAHACLLRPAGVLLRSLLAEAQCECRSGGHAETCGSSEQPAGREYLAGEDEGDLLWQLNANALHDPVWHRVCAAVLAPALQVLLCWCTILHHQETFNVSANADDLSGAKLRECCKLRTGLGC